MPICYSIEISYLDSVVRFGAAASLLLFGAVDFDRQSDISFFVGDYGDGAEQGNALEKVQSGPSVFPSLSEQSDRPDRVNIRKCSCVRVATPACWKPKESVGLGRVELISVAGDMGKAND